VWEFLCNCLVNPWVMHHLLRHAHAAAFMYSYQPNKIQKQEQEQGEIIWLVVVGLVNNWCASFSDTCCWLFSCQPNNNINSISLCTAVWEFALCSVNHWYTWTRRKDIREVFRDSAVSLMLGWNLFSGFNASYQSFITLLARENFCPSCETFICTQVAAAILVWVAD